MTYCGICPRLQRRIHDGLAPSSLAARSNQSCRPGVVALLEIQQLELITCGHEILIWNSAAARTSNLWACCLSYVSLFVNNGFFYYILLDNHPLFLYRAQQDRQTVLLKFIDVVLVTRKKGIIGNPVQFGNGPATVSSDDTHAFQSISENAPEKETTVRL